MVRALGKVTVTLAGVPVRLTTGQTNPTAPLACHGVLVQTLPANTGRLYVGTSTLNKSTFVGVLGILAIPTDNGLPSFSVSNAISPNGVQLNELFLDADVAGEGAVVSVLVT